MAESRGRVVSRGAFPEGCKVELFVRVPGADFWPGTSAGLEKVAEQKSNGVKVEFTGLEPGATFWAFSQVDEDRAIHRAVTAKVPVPEKVKSRHPNFGKYDPSTVGYGTVPTTVGARNSRGVPVPWGKMAGANLGEALDEVPSEPVPHLRQEDVPDGVPQRSATFTGQATPVGPPPVRLDEAEEGLAVASATAQGVAVPAVVPERQEDTDDVPQRSNTPEGTAVPVPDDALEGERVKQSPPEVVRPKKKAARTRARKTKKSTSSGKSTTAAKEKK